MKKKKNIKWFKINFKYFNLDVMFKNDEINGY